MSRFRAARRARGFLVIAAVFLLVVLAGLVAYMMTVSTTSQAASAADANSARAYQAARAGAEWAVYLITQTAGGGGTLKDQCGPGGGAAGSSAKSLNLGSTLSAFTVTVTCDSPATFTEGATSGVRVYSIVSNACNEPASSGCPGGLSTCCPNNSTTSSTYVNREVTLTISN
jgi:MSHA biogenesis protein MshP